MSSSSRQHLKDLPAITVADHRKVWEAVEKVGYGYTTEKYDDNGKPGYVNLVQIKSGLQSCPTMEAVCDYCTKMVEDASHSPAKPIYKQIADTYAGEIFKLLLSRERSLSSPNR